MPLAMPIVWDDRCLLHEPGGEIWIGVRTPGTETRERIESIRTALERGRFLSAERHPLESLVAVHDRSLLDYLASAWDEWVSAGLPDDPGQDRVTPYVFAHTALTTGSPAVPTAVWARPGFFAYDTMTLIGPETWEAALGATDAALTAVDVVLQGEACAYACCRPPGHHAGRTCYGGSCYLNNAAAAAASLSERIDGRVAVLDIDAHHGNGTQEIFYARDDVLVGSVHVDPAAGWFPHFLGFAGERGSGGGDGANRNLPLAPGSADPEYVGAVEDLCDWARRGNAEALVVSLGVDAAAGDPESPLCVTPAGLRDGGRAIGALGLPTVLVQEGGYDLETIGLLVRETLLGFEEARP